MVKIYLNAVKFSFLLFRKYYIYETYLKTNVKLIKYVYIIREIHKYIQIFINELVRHA